MSRILMALLLLAAVAAAQVAGHANSGYRTKEARAKVAGTLGAHTREETQKPRELVAAMKLEAGMTVADIGTGVGFMLPYLGEAVGASGKVIAEDIFPDFLDRARARAKEKQLEKVTFVQGTEKDPMLEAGTVDAALVLDVYHHFDYPGEMLAGIAKGLKPGGRLIIVDFYKEGFRDPAHIRLDQAAVAKEIEEHGFQLISTEPFQPKRQYISIFRKKE